jgi:hypothetical protein
MRMMSWSRYHSLSWSQAHARRRHAVKIHKTRRGNHALIGEGAVSAPSVSPSLNPGFPEPRLPWPIGFFQPVRCFQFLVRMFRTKARSGETDI